MHMFSYNSAAASFCPFSLLSPLFSSSWFTYFNRSFSSGDPRLAKGSPMIITARAKSSLKFNPSESFAPITAKRIAPFLPSGGDAYQKNTAGQIPRRNRLLFYSPYRDSSIIIQNPFHICGLIRLKEHLDKLSVSRFEPIYWELTSRFVQNLSKIPLFSQLPFAAFKKLYEGKNTTTPPGTTLAKFNKI